MTPIEWIVMASLSGQGTALAAVDDTQAADNTDVIEVTGHRLGQTLPSASVTTPKAGPLLDNGDWLKGLPGLQVDPRVNMAQDTRLVVRGFGATSAFGVRSLRIEQDGIPLSSADGQGQLSQVQVNSIDNALLIKGPLAALYGNAAGGVLQLTTKTPDASGGQVSAMTGEYGRQRLSATANYRQQDRWLSLSGQRLKMDGFRPHSDASRNQWRLAGGVGGFTAFTQRSTEPRLDDPQSETLSQWQTDPNAGSSAAETFDAHKSVRDQMTGASYQHGDWHLSGWSGDRKVLQYLTYVGDTGSGGIVDLDRENQGARVEWTPNWQGVNWTLGSEYRGQRDNRKGFDNDYGSKGTLRRNEVGHIRATDAYAIADVMGITAGVRYSHSRFSVDDHYGVDDSGGGYFNELAWALGYRRAIAPGWTAFASLGEGFETPTLTEMAYSVGGGGFNKDLKASHHRQAELGVSTNLGPWQATVTGFLVDSSDELVVAESANGRTVYENGDDSQRQGLEGQLVRRFADWQYRVSGTWLNAEFDSGERIPGVAKLDMTQQLSWFFWENQSLDLSWHHRSRTAATSDNSVYVPGGNQWDLGWQGGFGAVNLWAKVENLADEKLAGAVVVNQSAGRYVEPLPGREWSLGLSWRF
ncbi:TonB-dependent receptor domain-containing protein [Gallaecimonas mangrovi]|uniref:TonB-dependent receptor domain-containing protein n=1 Tax=Gallaecimonas mangrovi TaxID=2291597 RepID=UPI000E1FBB14|nr:TonB-dependent receptor [Gallaecimonas mangrovi]